MGVSKKTLSSILSIHLPTARSLQISSRHRMLEDLFLRLHNSSMEQTLPQDHRMLAIPRRNNRMEDILPLECLNRPATHRYNSHKEGIHHPERLSTSQEAILRNSSQELTHPNSSTIKLDILLNSNSNKQIRCSSSGQASPPVLNRSMRTNKFSNALSKRNNFRPFSRLRTRA